MILRYFGLFLLFIACNIQSMEITENDYVVCMAPVMALINKGYPQEHWETVVRQNWNSNQFERENFKNMIHNLPGIKSLGNDAVGNEFVAEMVPRMMQLSEEDCCEIVARRGCEIIARAFWVKDEKLRKEYRKYCTEQALDGYKTLDSLPEDELNIVAAFTKRSGKDTLRCVSKTLNKKIISQDELNNRYSKAHNDEAERKQLSRYNMFRPTVDQELLEVVKDKNIDLRLLKHCILLRKRYINFNKVLYQCIEAAMKHDNNAEVLKILIEEVSSTYWNKEEPLMVQAIMNDNIPLMRLLFKHGVDINAIYERCTILQHAVQKGKIEAIKELITYPGLDIDKKGSWNKTALFVAAQEIKPFTKSYDIIQILLDAGADPEASHAGYDRTVLSQVKKAVAQQMGRSPFYDLDKLCNWEIQSALRSVGSDPELANIICLIQDAIDKKHHPILGVHPGKIIAGAIGSLSAVMVASFFIK